MLYRPLKCQSFNLKWRLHIKPSHSFYYPTAASTVQITIQIYSDIKLLFVQYKTCFTSQLIGYHLIWVWKTTFEIKSVELGAKLVWQVDSWLPNHMFLWKMNCSGGHGFDSCQGLRYFLCPTLVPCWIIHLSHFITKLKFTIFIHLSYVLVSVSHKSVTFSFLHYSCWL